MNPFGSGKVVEQDGFIVDDGDFYTANREPVISRAYAVYKNASLVGGAEPPRRWPKANARPEWMLTREELKLLNLRAVLPAGVYYLRLWGVNETDPDYYEIGSGNANDNGNTDVNVGTYFEVPTGSNTPPPPNETTRETMARLAKTWYTSHYDPKQHARVSQAGRIVAAGNKDSIWTRNFQQQLAEFLDAHGVPRL